ncbi:MAG: hypothetical protein OXE02_15555, partial [Chloroflexi bacterium]|nr:hypothetical protein [Chloroflexota bacterium]
LEAFTPEGMVRLYIPPRVMARIYAQHAGMVKKAKSDRAKTAAETRRGRGIVPFPPRTVADEEDDALDDETDRASAVPASTGPHTRGGPALSPQHRIA